MALWTCSVCSITMKAQNQRSHLDGKRHAARCQARGTTESSDHIQIHLDTNKTGNPSTADNTAKGELNARRPKGKSKNKYTGGPASHNTNPIQAIPVRSKFSKNFVQNTDELPECIAVCDISISILRKCTICNLYMFPASGPAHLICDSHLQKLLSSFNMPSLMAPHEQDKKDLEAMIHCQTSNLLQMQQNNSAQLLTPKYNDDLLSNASYETRPKPDPITRFWTCPHCNAELDSQQNDTHHCPEPGTSTPSISENPLDEFFHSFPKFPYDACAPPATSYKNLRAQLRRWHDWDGKWPTTWEEYLQEVAARYQAALTQEFNLWFGTEDDLKSWHALCRAVRITPLPSTCKQCRSVSISHLSSLSNRPEMAEDIARGG